ncbi:Nif3-like dinuclear metal center hexameric protein [Compostimonas suwonensis]|uniref:GTP cyclohydrolase 1 type 2 homolog n=1 Tax=Compostimonas suwonensis TaxID=1048394 RepID=A0A2M9BBF0_9MICO|nr:Nif3-like dinuclear metal center hexameric protein [Compostimonas suwonensis]PJJ55281.1 dinuclear metal center YbgI/SA1388 family protein [Compostimonas suwonensis]
MSYSVAEVNQVVESLWPTADAEAWDAPGLISGDPDASVSSVLLAVDAVAATVSEATSADVDLLLVHHPLLLRGVTTVAEDRYKGALLARLIRARCALIAAHTNADIVADGVSDILAQRLGLRGTRPIVPTVDAATGIGRVGHLDEPTTLGRLARTIAELLPSTASGIRVAGDYDAAVETVALCGGAGDSLLSEPAVTASDVYITADLRHHPASEAREQAALCDNRPALVDVSHWASEWLWLEVAAGQLRSALPELRVAVSDVRTDPWDFVIVQ